VRFRRGAKSELLNQQQKTAGEEVC